MEIQIDKILHTILLGTVAIAMILFIVSLIISRDFFCSNIKVFIGSSKKNKYISWIIGLFLFSTIYALGISSENMTDETYNADCHKLIAFSEVMKDSDIFPIESELAIQLDSILFYYQDCGCIKKRSFSHFLKKTFFTSYSVYDYEHCFEKNNHILFERYKEIKHIIKSFYYKAKNEVFTNKNYYDELTRIQERIDLTRTLRELFKLFGFFIIFLSLCKLILSLIVKKKPSCKFSKHYRQTTLFKSNFFVILFIGVISNIVFSAILTTWEREELEFNKRVFGYYLTLSRESQYNFESSFLDLNKDKMGVIKNSSVSKYEPSGIVHIKNTNSFLIVNDKGGIDSTNHLSTISINSIESDSSLLSKEVSLLKLEEFSKFEAITSNYRKDDSLYTAITSFSYSSSKETPNIPLENQKIVIFRCPERKGEKTIKNIIEFNRYDFKDSSINHIKIEAISYLNDTTLVIGLREVGKSQFDFQYVCKLFTFNLKTNKIDFLTSFNTQKFEGISDLYISSENKKKIFYILTSIEKQGFINKKDEIGGNLYRIEVDSSNLYEELHALDRMSLFYFKIKTFNYKPEGISLFDENKAIVVFDTDSYRKGKGSNLLFPINLNEDYYTIFDLNKKY